MNYMRFSETIETETNCNDENFLGKFSENPKIVKISKSKLNHSN